MSLEWQVGIITYNVGMRPCYEEAVEAMMTPVIEPNAPDILVVGLQEVAHGEAIGGANIWQRLITDWITLRSDLVLLNKTYQATNQVMIFMKRAYLGRVIHVEFRYARNTLGGLTGHKGSIGTKITFKENESFVFVVSHFVHDVNALDRRIEQYESNKSCEFPDAKKVEAAFWLGDLNFRVELEPEETECMIKSGQRHAILKHEQLQRTMREGTAMVGYSEAELTFDPTYRFVVGSLQYDLKRTPSWCDRILYRGRRVSPKVYRSLTNVLASDHIPVLGLFSIKTTHLEKEYPRWDVLFERLPKWYSSIPIIGRLQYRSKFWSERGSYMDWIGLYPDSIDDCTTALKWIWIAACTTQTIDNKKFFVCEFGPVPAGKYRLAYFSYNNNCLAGLSKSFEVVDQPK